MEGFLEKRRNMRRESIDAVREGRALPTPEFAAKEGDEMLTVLAHEIEKLDPKQLDAMYKSLNSVKNSLGKTEADVSETLAGVSNTIPRLGAAIVGYLAGSVATGGMGGGIIGAVAMSSLQNRLWNKILSTSQRELSELTHRLERVKTLVERTKNK
jgi:hypothetical protein